MKQRSLGFTLIELMVVVLIIAILGAMGLAAYGEATQSARDGKRKSDMETVRQALLLHRQENTAFVTATNFNGITSALSGTYLSNPLPVDPRNTGTSVYSGTSGGTTFCICALLENGRGNHTNATCTGTWSANSGTHYCAQP